ncbi:hypothetical protein [Kribbella speibonae]|uniref:Uncharacterized protein n=1 Tax=Kribbella speibonae TaxID=1572660 RepID=A0A4R0IYN4_9ACTN|nr:hypothetical protein [Kribbella speibonae]TCC38387.1 hypothetical protein E0H92_18325 [Kribbella speibonae]
MAADSLHLPHLTVQQRPAKNMAARREGLLAVDETTNCVVLLDNNRMIEIAWPPGCAMGVRDGVPAVLDPNGELVGRLGDNVVLGGGHVSPEAAHVTSRTGRTRVFAIAGTRGLPTWARPSAESW